MQVEQLKEYSAEALRDVNILIGQLGLTAVPPKPLSETDFIKLLNQDSGRLLVVKNGPQIVGMGFLYFTQLPTGLIAELEDLVADRDYRLTGIGPAILKTAIETAEKFGAKHISLRTNPKRVEANKMYQAMGFSRAETNFYRINLPRK